jgi:prevent-host-death family protein
MKTIQTSKDILPLGDFKAHASQVLRKLKSSKRPIVITLNGKPAAILLTPAEFDRLNEQQSFLQAVEEGIADSDHKRVIADNDLDQELDAEFGRMEK